MDEKNQNDIPKGEDTVDDQETEDLSQTEKAAFEKIMAEISMAEDDSPKEPPPEKVIDEKPSSSDSQETDITRNDSSADTVDTETSANDQKTEDDLSEDQRAALDQIMSEIGGDDTETADTEPDEITQPPDEGQLDAPQADIDQAKSETSDDEVMSDDQQASLDKIMAEINGDDTKGDPAPESTPENTPEATAEVPPEDTIDQRDDEVLPEDQQAALDKIMAEINGDDTKDDPVPEPTPEVTIDQSDDEALPEDQQAALDQIMSEIKGDSEIASPTEKEETQPSPQADDTTPQTVSKKSATPLAESPKEADGDIDGLSMEEFDDQLTSLLDSSGKGADTDENKSSKPLKPAVAAAPDQSLADINSALKNIVKESTPEEAPKDVETAKDDDTAIQQSIEPSPAALQEIDDGTDAKKKVGRRSIATRFSKRWVITAVASSCAVILGAAYFGYTHLLLPSQSKQDLPGPSATITPTGQNPPEIIVDTAQPVTASAPLPLISKASSIPSTQSDFFGSLKADIFTTRQQLEAKKDEILDLKRYYQNGIDEERNKLRDQSGSQPPTFKAALQSPKTELSLRSIQRRMSYNAKLDTPLRHLKTALEKLLYLERRTRLFELLNDSISGLSLSDLKNEGEELIQVVLKQSDQLSIDQVQVTPPSLKSIWQGLNRTEAITAGPSAPTSQLGGQDRKIGKEICNGRYDRKNQLTALTVQTSGCLTKWPGKDLYLNELNYLSPEAAKHLVQWQGEWLSLNGIKTLSADTAKVLARWPGKRLSLNGITRLSAEATTYLAQWQGDQLEMVGLTSIGRWENYVTRLFLSESLRRKLQMQ